MEDVVTFLENVKFTHDWWSFLLPVSLMGLDVITGVTDAWIRKRLKSYKLREGLGKKVGELSALLLGALLTQALTLPIYVLIGISFYIVFMEVISIFENLQKLGVPIPGFIRKALGTANDVLTKDELSDDTKNKIKDSIKKKTGKEV